jgi:hypothetical protein
VTCFYLDRFRAHALGHEAFEIGVDGSIFGGHGIPAWLRPPCRVRGFAGEQGLMERPLNRVERLCLRFRQVAREITQESLLAQASFITIEYYACLYRKLDSAIMVMKSAEDGRRYDAASVVDGAMDRSVLVEGSMSPQLVIIGGILHQNPA